MECSSGKIYSLKELFFNPYVYSFTDPKSNQVRYIGKGRGFRAWNHLNLSSNNELHALIKKRERDGVVILPNIIQIFDEGDDAGALDLEQRLIRRYGRKDVGKGSLFNYTDGGEGDPGRKTEYAIDFRGETYPNQSSLCRAFGATSDNFRRRIGLGWSLPQALGIENKDDALRARPITLKGETFSSINKFADRFGLSPDSVRHFLDRGISPEDIVEGNTHVARSGNEIFCGKKIYPSLAEFSRSLGKSAKAVTYWLETGYSPEEIEEGSIINRSAVYTTWGGKTITQSEFASICKINPKTLIGYRKRGVENAEIFRLGHRTKSEKLGGKKVFSGSKTYQTATELSIELGVGKTTLAKWLNLFLLTPEECFRIVDLADEISSSTGKSKKGSLSIASEIVRGVAPEIRVKGKIVTKTELRNICQIDARKMNNLLQNGATGDEILSWARSKHRK